MPQYLLALAVVLALLAAGCSEDGAADAVSQGTVVNTCQQERDRWQQAYDDILRKYQSAERQYIDYRAEMERPDASVDLVDSAGALAKYHLEDMAKLAKYAEVCQKHIAFYKRMLEQLGLDVSPQEVHDQVQTHRDENPDPSWLVLYD